MPRAELHATVGDSVVLECSAVGNPQPVIAWEKYGGKLIPGRYTQKYGKLSFFLSFFLLVKVERSKTKG